MVSKLKQAESPESNEMVSNGWEFLGVINYYGGDHGLYDLTAAIQSILAQPTNQ